jgi:hypothetical protein
LRQFLRRIITQTILDLIHKIEFKPTKTNEEQLAAKFDETILTMPNIPDN